MAETQELATGETTEPEELTPEETEDSQESSTEEEGSEEEESEEEDDDRAAEHPAVLRCARAWGVAFDKATDEGEDEDDAEKEAKSAYLRSMPPLAGFENVRDYIACISYAQLTEVIFNFEAESLLATAKVALAAVRQEGRHQPSEPKRLGRPPKAKPEQTLAEVTPSSRRDQRGAATLAGPKQDTEAPVLP
jgi:hypothetical protein